MFTERHLDLACQLVDRGFLEQGLQAVRRRQRQLTALLSSRSLPATGWDDSSIEALLRDLASLDSNNFLGGVGAGEREGRVYNRLVRNRHFGLAHGMGRSGDVAATQPKAAGSSLLVKLCTMLVVSALKLAGLKEVRHAVVLPVATGMALALVMLRLRDRRPGASFVLFHRIDQKSCFKSIMAAGFEPLVIERRRAGDALVTDVDAMRAAIERVGSENVLAVMSTTSCFAPRAPDDVEAIARLAETCAIPHIVNNAYGLGCERICRGVSRAQRVGRVDYVVQSTDKNFMVPVGGSVVAGSYEDVDALAKTYPGRASAAPVVDLFITLLSMGQNGWNEVLSRRRRLAQTLKHQLQQTAEPYGFRVLDVEENTISFALGYSDPGQQIEANDDSEVPNGASEEHDEDWQPDLTKLGSMLFTRGVSGARVCTGKDSKTIGQHTFEGWGTHENETRIPYITLACAIGMEEDDIPLLIERFAKTLREWQRNERRRRRRQFQGQDEHS